MKDKKNLLEKGGDLKTGLHPRNKHKERYDFTKLITSYLGLADYVVKNKYTHATIDFSNSKAVKALNAALLRHFYDLSWDIPERYLCPPIPGRADYIHYLADLLELRKGQSVRVLDIGTGANCIFPIIGHKEYGWKFIGSDIDKEALESAQTIIELNDLTNVIELRLQLDPSHIFKGILNESEFIDACVCNPPFHASLEKAFQGTNRKWKNLKVANKQGTLNFGGKENELSCLGGEEGFIKRMIQESSLIKDKCFWFTTLVSKADHLPAIYAELKGVKALNIKTINMAQGQKKSRIVAWSFTVK